MKTKTDKAKDKRSENGRNKRIETPEGMGKR